MTQQPLLPNRKSPRLTDYDYAQEGAYVVTIYVQNRLKLFGHIEEQELLLNAAGQMVSDLWQKSPKRYPDFDIDLYVVMPNHFHGILLKITETTTPVPTVIGWFKSYTMNRYGKNVRAKRWKPYDKRLWQRSFHDHIIRNEEGLNTLRQYILSNPAAWDKDTFYEE